MAVWEIVEIEMEGTEKGKMMAGAAASAKTAAVRIQPLEIEMA